jgi:hypothetical protein
MYLYKNYSQIKIKKVRLFFVSGNLINVKKTKIKKIIRMEDRKIRKLFNYSLKLIPDALPAFVP